MSARNNFLAGCGAGAAAALVAATLLSPMRRRSSRSREEYSSLSENPAVEADELDAVDTGEAKFDRQPDLKLGSRLPEAEHVAQTLGDQKSSSKVALRDDPLAQEPVPAVPPPGKRAWYRRFRAADCVTGAAAVIVIVAVTWSSVAFQKQTERMTVQLTQSEATMRELREEVRVDQRAWIGLTEATVQPLATDSGGFTIKLQNTGKTPALDVQISAVITMEDIGQAVDLREPNPSPGNSAGTLMPGAGYTTDVWFKTSPDAMSSLTHDQLRVVSFVHVTYKDVFQGPHASNICFYWQNSFSRVKPCDGYNDLN